MKQQAGTPALYPGTPRPVGLNVRVRRRPRLLYEFPFKGDLESPCPGAPLFIPVYPDLSGTRRKQVRNPSGLKNITPISERCTLITDLIGQNFALSIFLCTFAGGFIKDER